VTDIGHAFFIFMMYFFVGELGFQALFGPPQEYSSISLTSVVPGEAIVGEVVINLQQGELLPAFTEVIVGLDGAEMSFILSELVDLQTSEGNFYVDDNGISGFGEGYGLIGESEFSVIDFDFILLDAGETPPIDPPSGGGGDDDSEETEEEVPEDARICQQN